MHDLITHLLAFVHLPMIFFPGLINNGNQVSAADFISTSAGAGSSGKVGKLDATGKTDKSFAKRFGVRATQNSGTGFSGMTAIAFQTEDFDDDTMHDPVTNNSRITFKTAGYWLVGGCIKSSFGTTGNYGMKMLLNGTTVIAGGGGVGGSGDGGASVQTVRHFNVNDYVEVLANSPSGASTTSGDEATNFWALLVQTD